MNPFTQIFITVISGVFIFVIGQIIIKFIIEPIHQLKLLFGEIADDLIFYADIYSNPGIADPIEARKGSDKIRKDASTLNARLQAIPFYLTWHKLNWLPSIKDVTDANVRLIQVSNSFFKGGDPLRTGDSVDKIKTLLRIKF